jgi:hypothetical protein
VGMHCCLRWAVIGYGLLCIFRIAQSFLLGSRNRWLNLLFWGYTTEFYHNLLAEYRNQITFCFGATQQNTFEVSHCGC